MDVQVVREVAIRVGSPEGGLHEGGSPSAFPTDGDGEHMSKSLHEAIELSSMKVGLFFMLLTFPSTTIICRIPFDCLWNISSIYIRCLIFKGILAIFVVLSFELCEVFGHECYVVCNFYKEKEECILGVFRFVNVPSFLPNVSWYFDWCLLTCA
jgi:hypothetical protein